jgi:V8-like Glu-specific endopeptidase
MYLASKGALAALATLTASACLDDRASVPGEATPAPPLPSSPSPSPEAALAAAAWEDLGPARFADRASASAAEYESAGPPVLAQGANAPGGDTVALRMVDVHAGREHRVRIDRASLRAISARAQELGLDRGSMPDDAGAPPDAVVLEGWSNNHDSRILRTNTTTYPYRAIGTLFDGGGDCTGTRIGPRLVLTAAHCIYDRDTRSWNTINFKPGRNGTTSAPYGSSGAYRYWVPDEYITLASGLNGYDIGLIVLDTPVGNGWMGYGAWSGGFLDDQDLWMRGYPRCNTTGAPDGCLPKTLWGDTKTCELGTFFDMDGDGWNRQIKTNCDGSAGQSGSSFYYYTSDGAPASVGVFSQHYCLAGCPESEHNAWPNVITRITPTYLDVINLYRAAFP